MKYFTLDWWNGIQEIHHEQDPLDTYEEYFQSIKANLPSAFLKLHDEIYLHDGNVTQLKYVGANGELYINLNNGDGNGNLQEITLFYSGVTLFESNAKQDKGLPGPLGYGDLGYDEVEILENGLEHRILFSSGIEFRIQFKNMELSYKNHE
jgi:Protein of unknown function (DUF4085)